MHGIPQEVLYRLRDVVDITGRKRSTIYRAVAEGTFPRPVQLGPQSVAWRKSDLDRWIASRPITTARAEGGR
ncbi:MAG TPA: AlpA family phage regulatory protein [Gemmatimonadaceae bacterium]|nr:AlpA family phage regulatory protein [Gemmatimonadaceae bacterium]